MASKIALGVPCDHCGRDEYWDNRESKQNPKAPDYKCANKECRDPKSGYPFGRWEKDRSKWGKAPQSAPVSRQEPAGAPKGGRLTPDDTTPDERGERVYTWEALCYTYGVLYAKVAQAMVKTFEEGTILDQSAIQAGVATLLIQGEKAHIPLLHPRKATKQDVQKPEPKPEPVGRMGQADNMDLEEDFEPWP